ncbi:MAG: 50S ribosomal protein L24 [Tistlia sp.]|uniref:50S ribosomal protein L24 n=1 Tax=Tistlia sp. TaxID=3057121 RepID=UPI0034A2DE6E
MKKFKIRKGDRVVVTTGKDRGKAGDVLRVLRKDERVLVQGVNLVKKHQRQSARQEGGIVEIEAPVHISNVAHVDPNDGKATRVGWKVLEDGRKVRFSRRTGETIDR